MLLPTSKDIFGTVRRHSWQHVRQSVAVEHVWHYIPSYKRHIWGISVKIQCMSFIPHGFTYVWAEFSIRGGPKFTAATLSSSQPAPTEVISFKAQCNAKVWGKCAAPSMCFPYQHVSSSSSSQTACSYRTITSSKGKGTEFLRNEK